MERQPLVVIVGPTASGKTGLAIKIAKAFGGEVISADARAIYKGIDVGAAKPTIAEQDGVAHWGIDLIDPNERYSVADFKAYANQKIQEIRARGHLPILAGGTGLYIDAVLFDFEFPIAAPTDKREKWEKHSIEALHDYCAKHNIQLPENKNNKRYVINTIVRNGHALKRRMQPLESSIVVGIATERDVLRTKINKRIEQIFNDGVIDEATALAEKFGWNSEPMKANYYPLIEQYIRGEITITELKDACRTKDWHLAKRQLTWFKRNEHIKWLPLEDAYTSIAQMLDNLNNL